MNHRAVALLLADLIDDRIQGPHAEQAWRHVAVCRRCHEIASVMRSVRRRFEFVRKGSARSHPSSDEIVALAFELDPVDVSEHVRAHVEACPSCQEAVTKSRWIATTGPPWRGQWEWWVRTIRGTFGRWTTPIQVRGALAISLVLVAVPAFLQFLSQAELRDHNRALTAEVRSLRDAAGRSPTSTGASAGSQRSEGAARGLLLDRSMRGIGGSRASVIPGRGQEILPILVAFDPVAASGGGRRSVSVSIRRSSDDRLAWRFQGAARDLWDPTLQVTILLVPLQVLGPGGYRVSMRSVGDSAEIYSGEFEVADTLPED